MSAELIWEAPAERANHLVIVSQLRKRPGEWARIGKPYKYAGAKNMVTRINSGELSNYAPAGDFEAASRIIDGQHYVYVRYLGDGARDE